MTDTRVVIEAGGVRVEAHAGSDASAAAARWKSKVNSGLQAATLDAGVFRVATTPRRVRRRGPAPGTARTAGRTGGSGNARPAGARVRCAPASPRGARPGGTPCARSG